MSDAALESAFLATHYRVFATDSHDLFDLRIGIAHPLFDDFLKRLGVSCWAIVTAYNPGAQRLSDAENQRRQMRFLARIAELGWTCRPACNLADAGDWPPEPACLLLQVDEASAHGLAVEFGQRALVAGDLLGVSVPHLVWVTG